MKRKVAVKQRAMLVRCIIVYASKQISKYNTEQTTQVSLAKYNFKQQAQTKSTSN